MSTHTPETPLDRGDGLPAVDHALGVEPILPILMVLTLREVSAVRGARVTR